MVGLTFVDSLRLTPVQWCAVCFSMGVLLSIPGWRSLVVSQSILLMAFWKQAISIDTQCLFSAAKYLSQYEWPGFLSDFALQDYVRFQPPFYTFWVSRLPCLAYHQILQAGLAVGCGLLLFRLYGEHARLLVSTPLFLLMSTQPSNDFVLFCGLVVVLCFVQMQRRTAAAICLGLLWLIKPLMILTIPLLFPKLKGWLLVSLGIIGLYVTWSLQYPFGIKQWNFILFQLSLGRFGAH